MRLCLAFISFYIFLVCVVFGFFWQTFFGSLKPSYLVIVYFFFSVISSRAITPEDIFVATSILSQINRTMFVAT